MPVPSSIADLSTTPGSNSPLGGESPSLIDDYIRTHASFIKVVSNAGDVTAATAAATAATVAGLPAPVDLTTNQTVNGSKSFVKGVGVAGEAAAETGWTLTGYLRGLLLPATRAIWWAKGAATRSIGIVRQSGSNLLRLVSSTADDGSAAAFDALTVDTSTGAVVTPSTVTGASFVSTAADASNGGKLEIAKPTGSGLSGNAALRMLNNSAILQDLGNSKHVFFDLVKAAVAGSDGFFVVESNLVADGGYLVFSNGFIMQWGITGPITSGGSLVVTFPKQYQSSIFIAMPVDTATTNNSFSVPARSNTNFTAFRKSHGSGGGGGTCAWFSCGV